MITNRFPLSAFRFPLFSFLQLLLASLAILPCPAAEIDGEQVAPGVFQVGRITHPRIAESSGIVLSRTQPGVFWTHNDGGGKKQILYAINRSGDSLGEYRVTGALLDDWEDIAADNEKHLFIGDIGNNDARRREVFVHEVDEPVLRSSTAEGGPVLPAHPDGSVAIRRTWPLRFPAKPFDCESLFVWEKHGYVISKVFNDERAVLYRFSLTNTQAQILEVLGPLRITSPVTGADISADGKMLGIVAKNGAYVDRIKGDPARAVDAKLHQQKFRHEHIEACTFVPEGLLATAESRQIYLFTDEDFRPRAKK